MSAVTLAGLREGAWLSQSRVAVWASAVIVVSIGTIAWTLSGHGLDDPDGHPIGTDFVSFWSVAWALHHGFRGVIYAPDALAALERALLRPAGTPFFAWQYPPTALFVVYPFGRLPYLAALVAWLAVGLASYLSALWRILPRPLVLWAGLGFPAVLLTLVHGQNALLTTALCGWALALLWQLPVIAGVLIGILSFKPQLGFLVPFALIAGGHWRSFASAALTALFLAAAAALLFGADAWRDFAHVSSLSRAILDQQLVPYFKMQSVFAALRLAGAPLGFAYLCQAAAAAAAAAVVVYVWRGPADADTKAAALLAATPLASPFFLDYDLMVLAPALAFLARRSLATGLLPWEAVAYAAAALVPLLTRAIGQHTHVLLAPLTVTALLAVILRRVVVEGRHSTDSASDEAGAAATAPAGDGRLSGRQVKIADIA
jgi:alpha-1,2-mannosyltransferase